MGAPMDIGRIWGVIPVSLPSSHPMEYAMEMVYVIHRMEKPSTTAQRIVVVATTSANTNLERRLKTAHRTAESVEMGSAMHLRVVRRVSKTVAHV